MKKGKWVVKFIVLGIVALTVIGLVTQLLWNWLVPALFSGPVITYWQALGLLVLSKILFWGFGRGGSRWGGRHNQHWAARWNAMSPEDRERFKQKMKDKWCYKAPAESSEGPATTGS